MNELSFRIYWVLRNSEPLLVATAHNQPTAVIIARELSQRNLDGFYRVCDSSGDTVVYVTKELTL